MSGVPFWNQIYASLTLKFGSPSEKKRAEPTGLEPATSSVTGRRSNQLSYGS